ncbi:MAG TPA: hypothetical protein VEA44_07655 [Caulobacter sp.]|nr:hypothetical protein [Caulobacter sp.]
MRPGLVLLLIGLPSAAMAAEDRYGPTRRPDPILARSQPAASPARDASGYNGRMLSWSGKADAAAPAVRPPPPVAPSRPQAMASRSPEPTPPARLPTSLYDTPAPAPAAAPAAGPAPPPGASSAPAAWPSPQPQAALPPPPSPPRLAAAGTAYSAPRAYSVVREYGGTPDRIPPPPPQSAFTGREVALDPGLLSERRDEDPPEDETEEDAGEPARKPAKERK